MSNPRTVPAGFVLIGRHPDGTPLYSKKPMGERDRDAVSLATIEEHSEVIHLTPKRFRQETKPLMNGLEKEWYNFQQRVNPQIRLHIQAKRYRLGNGKWYKPDFTGHIGPREMAWEVKGAKAFRDAMDTIKWAAHEWTDVTFTLVWKDESGNWQEQIALP